MATRESNSVASAALKVVTLPGVQATTLPEQAADTAAIIREHRVDLIACLLEEIGTEAHQMDCLCELAYTEDGMPPLQLTHALWQSLRRVGALADAAMAHGRAGMPKRREGGDAWVLPPVCRNTIAEIRKIEADGEVA